LLSIFVELLSNINQPQAMMSIVW